LEELQTEFNRLCELSLKNKAQVFVGGPGFDQIKFSHPAVIKRLYSMEDVYYT
jgi:hypothetical protein